MSSRTGKWAGPSVSGTLVSGLPNRFPSGGKAVCVVHSVAEAIDLTGDAATADSIGALALRSLALRPGENRMQWVQTQVRMPHSYPWPLSPGLICQLTRTPSINLV